MSLAKSYTLVGSATLASRLTGFVRDVLIAAVLGSGAVADAYFAAFLLPNLFRRVLSEGAFNAAFVPIYARLRAERNEAEALAFAERALASLVALVFVGLLLAEWAMPAIIAAVAPGFTGDIGKFTTAVLFGRIAFIFIGALVIVALLSSLLNALGRFGVVALAPLILNGVLILTLLALLMLDVRSSHQAGLSLVVMVAVAGILQLLYVVSGVFRARVPIRLRVPRADRNVRQLVLLILPGLMIAGAGHVNMLVAAQMSSDIPGAVSWLYYADRIFQLPLGFVAAAIGVVLLPEVSRAIQSGQIEEAHGAGCRALEFGLLLVLPAALSLALLSEPIVDLLFRRGAFSPSDSHATASVLKAIALGLPGFVLVKVFLPPFLARETLRLPIVAAVAGILINIAVIIGTRPAFGHMAPGLGVAASAWTNAMVLAGGLWQQRLFRLDDLALHRLPRILILSIVTGGTVWLGGALLAPNLSAGQPFGLRAMAIAVLCLIGVTVQAGLAHLTGTADLAGIAAVLRRRKA